MLFIQGFDKSALDASSNSLVSQYLAKIQMLQGVYNNADDFLFVLEQDVIAMEQRVENIKKNADRDFKDLTEEIVNFCPEHNGFDIDEIKKLLDQAEKDINTIKNNRDKINNYKKDPDSIPQIDAQQCGTCDACNSCNTDCQTCDMCQSSYQDVANACGVAYTNCSDVGACDGPTYGYVIGCGSGQGCGECNWNDDVCYLAYGEEEPDKPPIGCTGCNTNYYVCTTCNGFYIGCNTHNDTGNCRTHNDFGACDSKNDVNDCYYKNLYGKCYQSNDVQAASDTDTGYGVQTYSCLYRNILGNCYTMNNYNRCVKFDGFAFHGCVEDDDISIDQWISELSEGYESPCRNCNTCDSCNTFCNSTNSGCEACYIGCYTACYLQDKGCDTCHTSCDCLDGRPACYSSNASCWTGDATVHFQYRDCQISNSIGICLLYDNFDSNRSTLNEDYTSDVYAYYCTIANSAQIDYDTAVSLIDKTCLSANTNYACVMHNLSGFCAEENYTGNCSQRNIAGDCPMYNHKGNCIKYNEYGTCSYSNGINCGGDYHGYSCYEDYDSRYL